MTASRKTELISLATDQSEDPGLAVCFGRGTLRKDGHLYRVEPGKRTLVSRALCVVKYYGNKCSRCPNSQGTLRFRSVG